MPALELAFAVTNEVAIIDQLLSAVGERAFAQAGLNIAQFSVLNHFVRLGGERTPVELARAFQITKAAMTNTAQRLHAMGLVDIEAHPEDGRSKLVRLNAAGAKAHAKALAAIAPELERLTQGLGMQTLNELLPLLRTMRTWLDNNR